MSFSFGFSGDDIEDDGETEPQHDCGGDAHALVKDMTKHSISDAENEVPRPKTIEPKRHSLAELLESLPSQISYNPLTIPRLTVPNAENGSGGVHANHIANPKDNEDTKVQVLRRSLFDIRAQLMAEADPETHDDAAETMLAGLENGDLTSGIYEGGFKTWECALDLASLVTQYLETNNLTSDQNQTQDQNHVSQDLEVIELGAGSAIPSLALLRVFLKQSSTSSSSSSSSSSSPEEQRSAPQNTLLPRLKFTLCDYNAEVLRLCTAPNVFLNYYQHYQQYRRHQTGTGHGTGDPTSASAGEPTPSSSSTLTHPQEEEEENPEEGELDIEEVMGDGHLQNVVKDMELLDHVSFDFLSGGWGESFLDLIADKQPQPPSSTSTSSSLAAVEEQWQSPGNLLILASETIYSPSSSRIFADTLLGLLRCHGQSKGTARAWVAAKKVYFGVGGGVDAFVAEIQSRGGRSRILLETKDTGVGRVVLEITV
ncbi:hypothetical protein HRR83_004614 [Exophiala dermatitidis]|uniref:protein-histidine N-methyltransferase n=2 Tax=Exophiala dermatitidis TaxID=5970 RepID=H6BRG3_EXODN|nr:uncharacterized protein HMPREF1120_02147 [Exophiala dermatitidis NIH/UT8656]KAJ4515680.1 hypothetical protein HRR75_003759 [Exophiala dermatitidis]EHY53968.1 hypothetical protein HMPREF1120_02147 [Exophiala dermatitidis NIH/UT8656]KAJ4519364.1 hypothetical protein HRR74_004105 [Exophiala dermatitidis]KAJ4529180.1 hypothetical protein HRR73_000200 [Exophiala dermatitidis]KAJ4544175.1 hypothetical protein HRR76_002242 [Exophiala dermatitidis]